MKRILVIAPMLVSSILACSSGDKESATSSATSIDPYQEALANGNNAKACKELGEEVRSLGEEKVKEQLDALFEKFGRAGCASIVNEKVNDMRLSAELPAGVTPQVSETIAWWNDLGEDEKAGLGGVDDIQAGLIGRVGRRIGSPGRFVVGNILATIQSGDREGPNRRAERQRDIREMHHQRREGNRQIEHERRQREREVMAGVPEFGDEESRPDTSLDF